MEPLLVLLVPLLTLCLCNKHKFDTLYQALVLSYTR